MFGTDKNHLDQTTPRLDGRALHIGVVQARAHEAVSHAVFAACKAELLALGVLDKDIHHVTVPGVTELPLALQALAEKSRYDALVAIGCTLRLEPAGADLAARESVAATTSAITHAFSRLTLDYQLPIATALLTSENLEQAVARQTQTGRDAARVAVEMANLLEDI